MSDPIIISGIAALNNALPITTSVISPALVDLIQCATISILKYGTMKAVAGSDSLSEIAIPINTAISMSYISNDAIAKNSLTGCKGEPITNSSIRLIENRYDLSTIEEQLQAGREKIVIGRELVEQHYSESKDGANAYVIIKERVVDSKYLNHGNLSDCIEQIRNGEIPTIHQIFLAIIDLTDIVTFQLFRPFLQEYMLESAQFRLKELGADIAEKQVETDRDINTKKALTNTEIQKKPWNKPDNRTDYFDVTETKIDNRLNFEVTNLSEVTTKEYEESDLDAYLTLRKQACELSKDNYAKLEDDSHRNGIDLENTKKQSMVIAVDETIKLVRDYNTKETGYNRDWMRNMLGVKVEKSDTSEKLTLAPETKIFIKENGTINYEKLNSYEKSLDEFSKLELVSHSKFDEQVISESVLDTKSETFEDGWITYIPGGSLATLRIKADLDAKITMGDIFWAGVDVACFVAVAFTTPAILAAKTVGKTAIVSGGKILAKNASKHIAKNVVKNALKSSSLKMAKAEVQIYRAAKLEKAVINGKKCRIRSDIDLNFKDATGLTNLERMERGLAPIEKETGLPYELHHILQNPNSGLAQLTRAEHRLGENNKILHKIRENSPISHGREWDIERSMHWKSFAKYIKNNLKGE